MENSDEMLMLGITLFLDFVHNTLFQTEHNIMEKGCVRILIRKGGAAHVSVSSSNISYLCRSISQCLDTGAATPSLRVTAVLCPLAKVAEFCFVEEYIIFVSYRLSLLLLLL